MVEINTKYLSEAVIKRLQNELKKKENIPLVVLGDFFTSESYHQLRQQVKNATFLEDKDLLSHSYRSAPFEMPKELNEFIIKLIGKKTKLMNTRALQFSWKDYSILHDEKKHGTYDIILDLTEEWDSSFGGIVTYVDGSGEYTALPASTNSVSIIKTRKSVRRFIEYVNNHAKKKKRLLLIAQI